MAQLEEIPGAMGDNKRRFNQDCQRLKQGPGRRTPPPFPCTTLQLMWRFQPRFLENYGLRDIKMRVGKISSISVFR